MRKLYRVNDRKIPKNPDHQTALTHLRQAGNALQANDAATAAHHIGHAFRLVVPQKPKPAAMPAPHAAPPNAAQAAPAASLTANPSYGS